MRIYAIVPRIINQIQCNLLSWCIIHSILGLECRRNSYGTPVQLWHMNHKIIVILNRRRSPHAAIFSFCSQAGAAHAHLHFGAYLACRRPCIRKHSQHKGQRLHRQLHWSSAAGMRNRCKRRKFAPACYFQQVPVPDEHGALRHVSQPRMHADTRTHKGAHKGTRQPNTM